MSFHFVPLSRRRFLTGVAGGLTLSRAVFGETAREDRWALLSDTHIAGDRNKVARNVNMADNLAAVVDRLLSSDSLPFHTVISGDLALGKGESDDYRTLLELLRPLRKADLPIHLTLGNHDHRENFRDVFSGLLTSERPMESRHVAIVESPNANWFMLDSLDVVNATPGTIGSQQIRWLAQALDDRRDKPALIVVHHHPQFDKKDAIAGIVDTAELFEKLTPRSHVKAVFFGHTHHWDRTVREGIHLVNLPPTAYIFKDGDPNGWVDALIETGGCRLTLRTLDRSHPADGQTCRLDWRPER